MTIMVPIKEAKNRLSELARLVREGEEVVVTRHGQPEFEMTRPRKRGLDFEKLRQWKEEHGYPETLFGPLPSDFDAPLPADFLISPFTPIDPAA